ncbi:MAG TPA: hypothetical protein VFU15_05890 [Bacteroidia bacterium]|nr:hypothetical protein [Bacteroidia bacterium]
MKKTLLIFSLALITFQVNTLSALTPQGKSDDVKSYWLGPGFGYYFLPMASVNAQLGGYGVKTGFGNAMGVGLDYSAHVSNDRLPRGGSSLYSFHYLLPQTVKAGDSLTFRLGGYAAQFDIFSFDFLSPENMTLVAGLSWAFGQLKVTETTKGGTTTCKNPYFAPEFRTEFSMRLGDHFFFGLRGAYRADISKTGWKESGINNPALTGTKLSGWMTGAFIGFGV